MRVRHAVSLLALVIAGCAAPHHDAMMAEADAPAAAGSVSLAKQSTSTPATPAAAMPRRIIYTAQVDLVVTDLSHANDQLADRVRAHHGYVGGREVTGSQGENRRATWKVRIPVAEFETFLSDVQHLGEVQRVQTASQDVTEEYYDLDARLKNKQVEEKRLLDHLTSSSGRLQDILLLEKELSRVRGEVESLQGKLKLMANQTELTTVDVTLSEVKRFTPQGAPGMRTEVSRTWDASLRTMGEVCEGLVLFAVALAPWVAVAAVVLLPIFLLVRRRRA
jgi:hypothetical protein